MGIVNLQRMSKKLAVDKNTCGVLSAVILAGSTVYAQCSSKKTKDTNKEPQEAKSMNKVLHEYLPYKCYDYRVQIISTHIKKKASVFGSLSVIPQDAAIIMAKKVR